MIESAGQGSCAPVVARDSEAFDALVRSVRPQLYLFAAQLCSNPDAAEDLLALSLYRAYRAFDGLKSAEAFPFWVMKIIRNTYFTQLRAGRFRDTLSLDDPSVLEQVERLNCGGANDLEPLRKLESRLYLEQVREAIEALDGDKRQVVVLRMFEGLSYREISERHHIPISTLERRFSSGMRLVQQRVLRQLASDGAQSGR